MRRWSAGAAGFLAIAVAAVVAGPATPAYPAASCNGKPATIVGTSGPDVLVGTSGPDVIQARAGDDVIRGMDGADVICAGPGDDIVGGGEGADVVFGGGGHDTLSGDGGADVLYGAKGDDLLLGRAGDDRLDGGPGADVLNGGPGSDRIVGGGGDDGVRGAGGDDTLFGEGEDDVLRGGAGDDLCDGGPGIDQAVGCEDPRWTEIGDRAPIRTAPTAGAVALTFDDGPSSVYTPLVLDVLARYDVKATFFVTGAARNRPELIRRMIDEGHSVQNHTCGHAWLTRYGTSGIVAQVTCLNQVVESITGITPRCVRPPFGATSGRVEAVISGLGMEIVMWDVDPWDFMRPGAAALARRVLGATRGGDVVLLHDTAGYSTINALPSIIKGLRDRGYTFETVCG